MPDEEVRMTVGEHLEELRRRLLRAVIAVVIGMIVCLVLGEHLFRVLFWPLALATAGNPPRLYPRSLQEPFSTYVRVSLVGGAILASPYALHQIWLFVAAGLYERERRAVRKYVLPSILLFVLGVAFFLVVVAPLVIAFFLRFARTSFPAPPGWGAEWMSRYVGQAQVGDPATRPAEAAYVVPWLTLGEYVSFITTLALVFGVGFQTPLVVVFLVRSGIVTARTMRRVRKYVFFVICVVSAIATPSPDVWSMMALAVPMYLLFEVGLVVARRKPRPRGS